MEMHVCLALTVWLGPLGQLCNIDLWVESDVKEMEWSAFSGLATQQNSFSTKSAVDNNFKVNSSMSEYLCFNIIGIESYSLTISALPSASRDLMLDLFSLQGWPLFVMPVRRLKVAGVGMEKPKLLCYVFIPSPFLPLCIFTLLLATCNTHSECVWNSLCIASVWSAWPLLCAHHHTRGRTAYQCCTGQGGVAKGGWGRPKKRG